mmetsp:Transcript_23952/g.74946  ORF Transcript_23952/g.74946 Transcript_23952/m.74946 type:complete len:206 (+) Transcript_23952:879-1496(+)
MARLRLRETRPLRRLVRQGWQQEDGMRHPRRRRRAQLGQGSLGRRRQRGRPHRRRQLAHQRGRPRPQELGWARRRRRLRPVVSLQHRHGRGVREARGRTLRQGDYRRQVPRRRRPRIRQGRVQRQGLPDHQRRHQGWTRQVLLRGQTDGADARLLRRADWRRRLAKPTGLPRKRVSLSAGNEGELARRALSLCDTTAVHPPPQWP